MPPLVSVIIPTYNRGHQIRRCLDGMLAQTYPHFEVLVVDDGSDPDDPTESVVRALDDKRFQFIRLPKHQNANVARNAGIVAAAGDFVAMLDSDDEWLPVHLARRIEKIAEIKCDGIYGSFQHFDGHRNESIQARDINATRNAVDFVLNKRGGAPTSTLFYTIESARTVWWDATLRRHQDYDFVIRYVSRFRLWRDSQITVRYNFSQRDSQELDFKSYIQFYETYKSEASPEIAADYLLRQLRLAVLHAPDRTALDYYRRELHLFRNRLSHRQRLETAAPRAYAWVRSLRRLVMSNLPGARSASTSLII
jgi:glycosyltransferase involved in cell wall biosynthesis